MKEYKHLNLAQRSVISALKASGMKQKKIAVYAECSPSTVSRELARNKTKTGKYSPKVAQEISEERKERFRKERKFTKEMKVLVIKYISEEQWSVEQIVGYCRKNGIPIVGKTTIYKFIHQDKENGGDLYKHTRHQLKHRSRALYTCKKKVEDKKSIEERPEVVSQKTEFGHWEIDLIVGAGNKGAILTLVEMTTKMLFMRKLKEGKKAKSLADELIDMTLPYKNYIKTITADNGKEFAKHEEIAQKLEIKFYFCKPYHSWERGANENTNGLIRQYIPKGKDFSEVTNKQIKWIENKLNNRPRKRLGYLTPNEKFKQIINQNSVAFAS